MKLIAGIIIGCAMLAVFVRWIWQRYSNEAPISIGRNFPIDLPYILILMLLFGVFTAVIQH